MGSQHALFRRLPADRGDGRARPRNAALRADEAGRPRPIRAPGRLALRRRPAAPGQRARHAVEHGRLPDQAEARRAGAHLPHDPRPARRPSSRGSAACTATPSSTPEAARRDAAAEGDAAAALRRPDHRRAKAMSKAPPSACWPAASPPPSGWAEPLAAPPATTALGALLGHITGGHLSADEAGATAPARARSSR